jgi:hypothetical protein
LHGEGVANNGKSGKVLVKQSHLSPLEMRPGTQRSFIFLGVFVTKKKLILFRTFVTDIA